MPKPSVPGLLDATVRLFVPCRISALIKFSGTPQVPNAPIRIVAPSFTRPITASAFATRLSIDACPLPMRPRKPGVYYNLADKLRRPRALRATLADSLARGALECADSIGHRARGRIDCRGFLDFGHQGRSDNRRISDTS